MILNHGITIGFLPEFDHLAWDTLIWIVYHVAMWTCLWLELFFWYVIPFHFWNCHLILYLIVHLNLICVVAIVETFHEKVHEGSLYFPATATKTTLVIELIQVAGEVLREVYVLMILYFVNDLEYYLIMKTVHAICMIAPGREKVLKLQVVHGLLELATIEVVLKMVAANLLEADGARSIIVKFLQLFRIRFEWTLIEPTFIVN